MSAGFEGAVATFGIVDLLSTGVGVLLDGFAGVEGIFNGLAEDMVVKFKLD